MDVPGTQPTFAIQFSTTVTITIGGRGRGRGYGSSKPYVCNREQFKINKLETDYNHTQSQEKISRVKERVKKH